MSFGEDLYNDFISLVNINDDEIQLVRNLQNAFVLLSKTKYSYYVDVIHGYKSFVDFKNKSNFVSSISIGAQVTRELGDMMYIVYSNKRQELRISFMQNKKNLNEKNDYFSADLMQLHLLKDRLRILDFLNWDPHPDNDVLLNARLPSVSSYGLFYKDKSNYNMSYFPADLIYPRKTTGKSIVRKVKYNGAFSQIRTNNGVCETCGETNLIDFANSLVNMQIGTPISYENITKDKFLLFVCRKCRSISKYLSEYIYENGYDNNFEERIPTVLFIDSDYCSKE